MPQLQAGDIAPDFALPDSGGRLVVLAGLGPGPVIVYFYPAALTPGCTREALDFSAAADAFREAGYRILGLSPDQPAKLARFEAEQHLAITLLSDPERAVITAYGAWGSRVIWGKAVEGLIRSTFVLDVDDQGRALVRRAWYNVRASGHVDRLRAVLDV
ncbi:MAG: peroxiredoxin [Propionibacteriaceae bacterium]|jgi:peroxiredoxin Q/BCP|nr:peroxiredoxin [Propionibacteriaceae bacterium]